MEIKWKCTTGKFSCVISVYNDDHHHHHHHFIYTFFVSYSMYQSVIFYSLQSNSIQFNRISHNWIWIIIALPVLFILFPSFRSHLIINLYFLLFGTVYFIFKVKIIFFSFHSRVCECDYRKISNKLFQTDCISMKKKSGKYKHIKEYGILDDEKVEFSSLFFCMFSIEIVSSCFEMWKIMACSLTHIITNKKAHWRIAISLQVKEKNHFTNLIL